MIRRKEQLHGRRDADRPAPMSLHVMRFLFGRMGGLFPRLLGRWAFRLWFRTRRFPQSAAGKRAVRNAGREILTVNNIPVVVHHWGSAGPVVLFVHGWSGRGSQVAAFVEPLTNAGYQVMALDLPGHGETPGRSTNILECAEVIRKFDETYGPLHAAITQSFGGMVLAYALNHGVRLERAVVIGAPSDIDFLLESFAATLCMHPAVVDELWRRLALRFDDDDADEDFSERISLVNNVAYLDVAALVIHDEQDTSVPWTQGQRIAATWPDARFMKTHGLGHGRVLRDKEVIDTAVRFISQ
ncbi:MAG: alpha/beta hydrolase [Gammaproteobacteria bacterium]